MDKIDRKIMALIAEDARASHVLLARQVRVSREVFDYRIHKMEKEGIIRGYEARINLSLFIYGGYIAFVKSIHITSTIEKRILEQVQKNHNTYFIGRIGNRYDYVIGFNVKSLHEVSTYQDFLNDIFGENKINISTTFVLKELRDSFKPIFIDKEENISIVSKPDIKERAKIDDTDKKILVALAQHGTLSSIQIGQELGITSVAVRNRIKKLLKKEVIINFRTMIDITKQELQFSHILIQTNPKNSSEEKRLETYLQFDVHNTYVCKILGEFNYFVTVHTPDNKKLQEYITNIKNKFSDTITDLEVFPLFEMIYHKQASIELFE